MDRLLVSGYSSFDLGIFSEKDPRVAIIQEVVLDHLEFHLARGLEWLIFSGNLGFEYWSLQVAQDLKRTSYPDLKLGTIFPFETHGQTWNQDNQLKLTAFHQVDFSKFLFPSYESPAQFHRIDDFLIDHTDGALIFYDEAKETSLHWRLDKLKQVPNYSLDLIDFEELQEVAENR